MRAPPDPAALSFRHPVGCHVGATMGRAGMFRLDPGQAGAARARLAGLRGIKAAAFVVEEDTGESNRLRSLQPEGERKWVSCLETLR
jgi:hypothetical protein